MILGQSLGQIFLMILVGIQESTSERQKLEKTEMLGWPDKVWN